MNRLSKLPNVGKVLEQNLMAVGVETREQLRSLGSKEVFLRIRLQRDSEACLRMLYGIQGAVEGVRDKLLSEETKRDLKDYYKSLG